MDPYKQDLIKCYQLLCLAHSRLRMHPGGDTRSQDEIAATEQFLAWMVSEGRSLNIERALAKEASINNLVASMSNLMRDTRKD